jgi:hypothetical protein
VSTKPISSEELKKCVDTVNAFGGNVKEAARSLGMARQTLQSRMEMAERRNIGAGAPEKEPLVSVEHELRDRIRTLEAHLSSYKRETLSERYIKEKILGLSSEKPRIPGWIVGSGRSQGSPGVPTLLCSDWHWGEVVDPGQVNGINEYNLTVAHARVHRLIEATIDLLDNHMVNPNYPGFVLALGGDMVSGDIHEELTATNEGEIMKMVIDLYGVLVWVVQTLVDRFGRLFIPAVSGNHGRDTKKIRAKGRNFTSFDWLLYQFLAKHFEGDSRIRFMIPDGPDALYSVYGHRYLLTHGDQFRGGDALIGALGPIVRGDHRKRSRNMQIGMGYDTIVMGHWHQLMQTQRFIVNGSLPGYSEYAFANNYPFEPPRQALWVTHPERGITFHMPVQVDPKSEENAGEWVGWKEAA